jgi:hypothetical protein
MLKTKFEFNGNVITATVDLGEAGEGFQYMFYFNLSAGVWVADYYKEFEPGEQSSKKILRKMLEVKTRAHTNQAIALEIDKAVLKFLREHILNPKIKILEEKLAGLIYLRKDTDRAK